jgi:secreted trypsin-like serine protease
VAGTPTDGQEMSFFVRGEHGCGGALIAPDIVLGAAHCQSTYDENTTSVVGTGVSLHVVFALYLHTQTFMGTQFLSGQ